MAQFAVRYSFGMFDTNGHPMPNAPYEIFLTGTTTPALIYATRLKDVTVLAPISNELGNAYGWLDPDTNYDVVFGGNPPQPMGTLPRDVADAGYTVPVGGIPLSDFSPEAIAALKGDPTVQFSIDPTTGELILDFPNIEWGVDSLGIYLETDAVHNPIPEAEAAILFGTGVETLQD